MLLNVSTLHLWSLPTTRGLHPPSVALIIWKDDRHECSRSVAVLEQVHLGEPVWVRLEARDKCKIRAPVCTDSVCTHRHCQPSLEYPDFLPCEVRGQRGEVALPSLHLSSREELCSALSRRHLPSAALLRQLFGKVKQRPGMLRHKMHPAQVLTRERGD